MATATSQHGLIARSLLQHIPQESRPVAVRDAIDSLREGSVADLGLALSLLEESPDYDARQKLLRRLRSLIDHGHIDDVLSLCAQNSQLQQEMLRSASEELANTARELRARPDGRVVVSLYSDEASYTGEAGEAIPIPGESKLSSYAVSPLLTFVKRILSVEGTLDLPQALFRTILFYFGVADPGSCKAAGGALFSLVYKMVMSDDQTAWLWTCISRLLETSAKSYHHDLAYTIWLRWVSSKGAPSQLLLLDRYWQMLREGLQTGDGERRKQCLSILRRSVASAAQEPSVRPIICSAQHDSLASSEVLHQYERYCTVFETVLLGRYLNQILECESDLNMLSSPHSAVKSEWLLALLASALAPKIQDSVRKFIGGWIMRSTFQPYSTDGFLDFFRGAFLPWATQGSLFTTTLRNEGRGMICGHGEGLATYMSSLLHRAAKDMPGDTQLFGAVLDTLSASRSGRFAYAGVYLLEGLGRTVYSTPQITVQPAQLERLAELSSWAALPEVARDYVYVRCIKMCYDLHLRSPGKLGEGSVATISSGWGDLQVTLRNLKLHANVDTHEPIATRHSESSKRDAMETNTMEKCRRFRDHLKAGDTTPAEAEQVLDDIWGDLEYLEHPKRLVVSMPALVLDHAFLNLALASETLGETLANLVRNLQELSRNRMYLFPPLVCAVRGFFLAWPEADRVISLEEFIITYAEHLPDATVDIQLEDATAQVLQSVTPESQGFGYHYYFGDRESLGVAALVDIVSRLGAHHFDIALAILNRLLQRWVKQRTPPPIVTKWKSTLQLQVLLLCCEQVVPAMEDSALLPVLRDLHYVLSIEPLPRYRYLLSWVIARIYLHHKHLRPRILDELRTKDHHSNPKYLASLMKIGVMVAKLNDAGADLVMELASAVVPLAASSKVIIRHEAQWQFPALLDYAAAMKWEAVSGNPAFTALDDYVRSLERFDDPPLERQLDRLDPAADNTLVNLVEGRWFGLDSIEPSLCGRDDFVKLYKMDVEAFDGQPDRIAASCMPLGDLITTPLAMRPMQKSETNMPPNDTKVDIAPSKIGETQALQTKGAAYLASDVEDSADHQGSRRKDLIVVASLVDNPYNLGGLSRVSEIFGASELHLQNQNVTGNKDFTNVSVSSHLHLPILQLSASAVPAYLASQRDDGWCIVGIEQTDRSILLGSAECKLPEKVVLVIGSEKEGIPALILSECDLLVEIRQQGVTRSLNVQTAAGIVLFEYAKQHKTSTS